MKKLFLIPFLLLSLAASAQIIPPMDTTALRYTPKPSVYSKHTIDSLLALKGNSTHTINAVTRALNTAIQISTTQDVVASYSVQITSTLSLSGGQSGTVFLETCSTSGGTYTVIGQSTNNNTGSLTIGLNTSQVQATTIVGFVPKGYYFKLVTSGTSTFSFVSGVEILL